MKKLFNKKILIVLVAVLVIIGAVKVVPLLGKTTNDSSTTAGRNVAADVKTVAAGGANNKATGTWEAGNVIKNETVYAKIDPAGNVKDTTVVNWFHFDGTIPDSIEDPVNLTDTQALNGSFKVQKNGQGVLVSSLDEGMQDVYYSGQTDKGLPVKLKINYYLDGKAIKPQNLAGKTGDVKIVFNVDNLTGVKTDLSYTDADGNSAVANKEIYTPLVTMISLELPADKFSQVQVTDGMMTVVGETIKVNMMVFPYPSSSVTLTMHADQFALGSASIIVQPQMPPLQSLDMEDKLATMNDGMKEINQLLGEAEEGSSQLSSGQTSMLDGLTKLKAGLDQLINLNQGEQKVAQGALTVNTMLQQSLQSYANTAGVGDLVKPVIAALEKQKDLLTAMLQGGEVNGQTLPSMDDGVAGMKQAQNGLDQLATGLQGSQAGAERLHTGIAQIRQQGIGKMQRGVADSLNELRIGQAQINMMKEKVNDYDSFMGKPNGVSSRVQFVIQTEEIK